MRPHIRLLLVSLPLCSLVLLGVLFAIRAGNESLPAVDTSNPVTRAFYRVRQELVDAVYAEGPRSALAILRKRAGEPDVSPVCHALAHEVGRAAQEKDGFERAILIEDDICGSGYVHGVIETHMATIADPLAAAQTFCKPRQGRCFHGLGHGLMYATGNDLPRSIDTCRSLPERSDRIQCAEGAFMENFGVDLAVHRTDFLREDDVYFPCRGFEEPYTGVCAFYAPRYYVRLHPGAYADALRWCRTLPEGPRDACAKGVGSAAAKENIADPLLVQSVCLSGEGEQARYCMEGLVSYTIVHYASTAEGAALCPRLAEEYGETCRRIVRESEPFYGRQATEEGVW